LAERAGATLLPGLIDAHVHLCGDSRDGALDRLVGHSDGEQAEVIEAGLRRQLAAGVTAVRDLGDRCFATLAWRRRPGLPEVVVSDPRSRFPVVTAGIWEARFPGPSRSGRRSRNAPGEAWTWSR
jgi:amidohydrolase family protein